MSNTHPERSIREKFATNAVLIVAILVLGLLGGLFHHHASGVDYDACSYCHAGVQTAALDLAGALVATTFAVIESVTPTRPSHLPRVVHVSKLVPRAPPVTTHPVMFWEGCVGLV
jgi:hypothetical protein